ncbi:hypothetical protein RDV64_22425 [Acuticoccus sp. MNP-M23]|uniref:hypothetical protein n=1 Tax=Acuticoccus sp. MNP-M23 TaxID=3072793 RepID=UPI00281626B4|nr:hypothetical protein [Acuticoccus sp. MNP-M23]WMS42775.1 hypothetical protein RDV64_22425 [Acuticoccus sp. MNP-M23]
MRLLTAAFATALIVLPASVLAQNTAPADGAAPAPAETGATAEIERIRADFRARFVDYDLRLKALERRIEALESGKATPAAAASEPETNPQP